MRNLRWKRLWWDVDLASLARRVGLGGVAVWAMCATLLVAAPSSHAAPPGPLSCDTALVAFAQQGEVVPVDVGNGTLAAPIPVPDAEGVAITPDGRTAWVVGIHATYPYNTVTPVDLATETVGSPILLTDIPLGNNAGRPVITPDGQTLVIGSLTLAERIDLPTRSLEAPIVYPAGFNGATIAVSPDGKTVLVGSAFDPDLRTIDLAAGTVSPSIGLAPGFNIVFAPDGKMAYADDDLEPYVVPIDVTTKSVDAQIPVDAPYASLAVTPDDKSLVVVDALGPRLFDLANRTMGPVISVPGAQWLVLTPDGNTALAFTMFPNQLVPVNLARHTLGTPIPLPGIVFGVAAMVPDQAPVANMKIGSSIAGDATRFDAAASSAECGPIATYTWDFGDGSPAQSTSSAVVDHTYARPGTYTARLTVTDAAGTSTAIVYTGQAMSRHGGPSATTAAKVDVAPASAPPASAVSTHPALTG